MIRKSLIAVALISIVSLALPAAAEQKGWQRPDRRGDSPFVVNGVEERA